MRPCIVCGEPSEETRCWTCARSHDTKPSARLRGYDGAWDKLSQRARRLQPFCTDCGTREDLTADHSETAWERHDAGLAIRLEDIEVVCRPCNGRRGAARPTGEGAQRTGSGPVGKAESRSLSRGTG